jgi:acetyl esterase
VVGRTYLERGHPVVVLARWGPGGGPRNVLIERADGSRVVRPFRGLRLPTESRRRPRAHAHGSIGVGTAGYPLLGKLKS